MILLRYEDFGDKAVEDWFEKHAGCIDGIPIEDIVSLIRFACAVDLPANDRSHYPMTLESV